MLPSTSVMLSLVQRSEATMSDDQGKPISPAQEDWVDPDDAPELDEEWFRNAWIYHGDRLIRRGKGPDPNKPPKERR
jgi:hypothetical protein